MASRPFRFAMRSSSGIVAGQQEGPTLLELAVVKKHADKIQGLRLAAVAVHGSMSFLDSVLLLNQNSHHLTTDKALS
jgi:hypothetical protein